MKTLKEILFDNGFFKVGQNNYTVYNNVINICSELALRVSEQYFLKKETEVLEHKSITVRFMTDLSDELVFPKNHEKLPIIIEFINKEFGKYGVIDTSLIDEDGSFSIDREEPLLSKNDEFLDSVQRYRALLLKEFVLRIE